MRFCLRLEILPFPYSKIHFESHSNASGNRKSTFDSPLSFAFKRNRRSCIGPFGSFEHEKRTIQIWQRIHIRGSQRLTRLCPNNMGRHDPLRLSCILKFSFLSVSYSWTTPLLNPQPWINTRTPDTSPRKPPPPSPNPPIPQTQPHQASPSHLSRPIPQSTQGPWLDTNRHARPNAHARRSRGPTPEHVLWSSDGVRTRPLGCSPMPRLCLLAWM